MIGVGAGLVVIILILGWWFLFRSHSGAGNINRNTNLQAALVEKEGTVRSKGITLDTPGTHKLELDDGSALFLESKDQSLSRYLDQRVVVEGVLEERQGALVLSVQSISLQLNRLNANGASALLRYSGALGLTFAYSSLFELNTGSASRIELSLSDKSVDVQKKDDPVIFIENIGDVIPDLKAWIKSTKNTDSVTIRVGNLDGERLVLNATQNTTVYVNAGRLYEIRFVSPGGKDETLVKNRFYEMLSTIEWSGVSLSNTNINAMNVNASLPLNINVNGGLYTGEVGITPTVSNTKELVRMYIAEHLNDLKPEDSEVPGTVAPTRFEFAGESYVYVEYGDNTAKRKLLLSYVVEDSQVRVSQKAYFVPGETTDWQIKTGQNEANKLSREVYDASGNKTAELKEGYRLYENKSVGYSVQYPSSWYYAGVAKEAGAIHTVAFSDKPLESAQDVIKVSVLKGTITSLGLSERNEDASSLTVRVEKEGRVYQVSGATGLSSTIDQMANSLR